MYCSYQRKVRFHNQYRCTTLACKGTLLVQYVYSTLNNMSKRKLLVQMCYPCQRKIRSHNQIGVSYP